MEETGNQEVTAVEKTFTQSELDSIVADRLRRERSKYEGFDEIKAKADKLDEIEAANKTELEKVVTLQSSLCVVLLAAGLLVSYIGKSPATDMYIKEVLYKSNTKQANSFCF